MFSNYVLDSATTLLMRGKLNNGYTITLVTYIPKLSRICWHVGVKKVEQIMQEEVVFINLDSHSVQ